MITLTFYFVAPILDKAVFDYNHENKARSEYPNVIYNGSPLSIRTTKVPQIFRGVTTHETGQVDGSKQMMGVKKHRMVINLPKPGTGQCLHAYHHSPLKQI